MLQTAPRREGLQQIGAWAAAGDLSCPITQIFDFANAIEAIVAMERSSVVGKVVIIMNDQI